MTNPFYVLGNCKTVLQIELACASSHEDEPTRRTTVTTSTMRTPAKVVWAAQSPTLLNSLARARSWELTVADFGDTANLMEMRFLNAPRWDGVADGIRVVFVCSPAQVQAARSLLPDARITLVAHQGYSHKLPECPEAAAVVCFSEEVARHIRSDTVQSMQRQIPGGTFVIQPWFPLNLRWEWQERLVWTMMNRPSTREAISLAGLASVSPIAKTPIQVFGQDQPHGELHTRRKEELLRASSAYFSALHPRAGIGLAEHEAMASGCPVVGFFWGDLRLLEANGHAAPRLGFRQYGDIYNLADLVDRIANDRIFAEEVRAEQSLYVAERFSREAMESSITELLDSII